jgi:dTDP-glucose 4,6-dehydratase/UDP-glucose 4-epimerase
MLRPGDGLRLLVIGSEGFAGQALVARAQGRGIDVVGAAHRPASFGYDHRLIERSGADFGAILESTAPEWVVLAASTGSVGKAQSQPEVAYRDTIETLNSLQKGMRQRGAGIRLIQISSMAVYGNSQRRPTSESEAVAPVSVYGRLKAAAEGMCRRAYRDFGTPTCSLRVGSLYGPGQRKQLFWDIGRRLAASPPELTLFGDGGETRDFLFIEDFADVVLDLFGAAPFRGEAINVGTGVSTSVKSAAEQLAAHFGFHGPFRFLGESPPHDPRHVEPDVSLLTSLVSVRPRPFNRGISEAAEWLKSELLDSTSSGPMRSTRAASITSSRSSPP